MPICSDLDEAEERRRMIFALDALLAIVTIELHKEERQRSVASATEERAKAIADKHERERRAAAAELARYQLRQAS